MENPTLDQQINNLQIQANRLHSLIMAEAKGKTSPIKRKRQDERADILHEITILRDKKEAILETEALEKINAEFRNTKHIIVVEVNNYRITLDEDFNFELKFSCAHTRKTHVSEMLSYQKACRNKRVLLTRWQAILNAPTTLTTSFSCEQCKAKKAKKFNLFRKHTPKDIIGTAQMSLRII